MDKKWVNISDVLFFQEGPGVRNTQYTTEGVKLLNVANLVDGNVDLSTSDRYISEEEAYGKYKHFLCDEGDLIVASSGIKVDYLDKKMGFIKKEMLPLCMNTSTIRFKTLDEQKLNIRYFMYYVKTQHYKNQVAFHITGSAQLNYGPSHLKKMVMPLIELKEQQKIVTVLDKVSAIIEASQEKLQKLDDLIKSRFLEMFGEPEINPLGWKATTLGNECYYIKDGPHKSLSDIGKGNGGYPFISVRNIVNGYIDFSTAKYISDEDYQSAIKKCHPEKGDILYSKGGTTGIAKLVDVDIRFANWVHLAVLKFDKSILNGVFLENMLNCDYCYMQSQKLTKGIANRDLVLSAIAQIKIYRPPIELQNQFAAFVHQIDKSKLAVQKSLEKLEILKKSLMQQYFGREGTE